MRGGREKKGTRNSCLRKQMLCCSSSVRDQFEREVHLPIKIYSTASQPSTALGPGISLTFHSAKEKRKKEERQRE